MGSNFNKALSTLQKRQEYINIMETLRALERRVKLIENCQNISRYVLKQLMKYINMPQKSVVGVSLNIIASYTMDKEFTREIIEEYAFIPQLDEVLTLFVNEENVEDRVLEILGNICQHKRSSWVRFIFDKNLQFVSHTIALLKCSRVSSHSQATLIMALRFLREILSGIQCKSTKQLVLDSGLLKTIGSFFIEVTLRMKNNETVLQNVIELIHVYSSNSFHDTIKETKRGESIMYVCRKMRFFSERIPTMMANFVKTDELDDRLRLPNVCDCIIQYIKTLNIEDSKDHYVSYICCLCFMLLDTCTKRHRQFLPELIKVLKFIQSPSYADMECIILIIMTINKYLVDDASLAKNLLDCDIVQTITEKLKWISGVKTLTLDFEHQMAEKTCWTSFARRRHQLGRCNHPNPMFKEEHSWVTRSTLDHSSTLDSSDYGRGPSGSCACTDDVNIDIMKNVLLEEIVNMIETYIRFHPSMLEIVCEELIFALLNCSLYLGQTFTFKDFSSYILCELIKSPVHMVELMRSTILDEIIGMMRTQHYSPTCAATAESDEFIDIMIYGLMMDTDERKTLLVLSIPAVVKDGPLLVFSMIVCDGLDILLNLIKDGSPLKERSFESLQILAVSRLYPVIDHFTLQMYEPMPSRRTKSASIKTVRRKLRRFKKIKNKKTIKKRREVRTVVFRLDDGSAIITDRDNLVKSSEYFFMLLEGNFKESGQQEVALHDIRHDLLSFILHVLLNPEYAVELMNVCELDFLLDAIVMADRHLMDELRDALENYVLKHRMMSTTVATIYQWSIESKLDSLSLDAATFALVCRPVDASSDMFNDLLAMGCTEELVGDMQAILVERFIVLADSLSNPKKPGKVTS